MSDAYAYTPGIWLPLASAIFLAVIALYTWRRRDVPGGKPFIAMSAVSILVLLGIAFESAAVMPTTKLAWYKYQFVMMIAGVTAVTCFVLDYAFPGRWLSRRNVILLSIPPILCLLAVVIDDSRLVWRQLEGGAGGLIMPHFAPAGAILTAYGLGMYLFYVGVFVWLFIRSPLHRWPVALMLFGQICSRTAFVLDNTSLPALSPLDLTIFVIILPWTTYAIALFGFRIFDPLPSARVTATDQMREGMIVLDRHGDVVSLNPAAAKILGVPAAQARDRALRELLPASPDPSACSAEGAAEPLEFSRGMGPDLRYYTLDVSPLKDFRELLIGYLVLLRDVTEERQAQARILEQHWAQATQLEREQLAYELHDLLSQDLAFLNLQAQAVQVYLRTDQREEAQSGLARLAEVSRTIQGDMRGMIGDLLTVSLSPEGLCAALRQTVSHFEAQSGLAARLDVDGAVAALCEPGRLSPFIGLQIIRIVQEALANVRRHAGAPDRIALSLRVDAGQLRLAITDDGAGFSPAQSGSSDGHFGLQVMRQRAERIGGRLAVYSAPGEGTRVEMCVPVGAIGEVPHAPAVG